MQGNVKVNSSLSKEDFIIHRRDGLFAYQLAVVVDDIYQGITEIVRGCDLLEPSARQVTLYKTFNSQVPNFVHLPLAVTDEGYKLSKQNAAPAIDNARPQPALVKALEFLGQKTEPEMLTANVEEIISFATDNWSLANVPKVREIPL